MNFSFEKILLSLLVVMFLMTLWLVGDDYVTRLYLLIPLLAPVVMFVLLIRVQRRVRPYIDRARESETLYRSLFESAVDAIVVMNERGLILSANPAAGNLLGHSVRELIGREVTALMPAPHNRDHQSYVRRYLETGQARIIGTGREVNALHKQGHQIPVRLSVTEIRLERRVLFIGTMHDLRDLRQAEEEIRSLSHQVLSIQEEERGRISREIHDELGTSLFLLKMMIQSARSKSSSMEADDLEQLGNNLEEIIQYLDTIVGTARQISHNLSPIGLKSLGLPLAISELAQKYSGSGQREIRTDLEDLENFFPNNWSINLYRIYQEALHNISKHSGATRVELTARLISNGLELRISDNGRGLPNFDVEAAGPEGLPPRGLGLHLIRERCRLLEGELFLETAPNQGTELIIVLSQPK